MFIISIVIISFHFILLLMIIHSFLNKNKYKPTNKYKITNKHECSTNKHTQPCLIQKEMILYGLAVIGILFPLGRLQ